MELWIENQKVNPMFDYWFNVLRSIKIVFLIIRSFREANIDLLVASLELMVLLFFSLDHFHHSRWVSVFMQDLKLLPVKLPSLYDEFKKGNFVVNTCGNSFSKFTIGQAQKHCNKKIKSFLVISIWSIKRIKNSFKKLNYAGKKIISTWNLLRVAQWHKVTRRKPLVCCTIQQRLYQGLRKYFDESIFCQLTVLQTKFIIYFS